MSKGRPPSAKTLVDRQLGRNIKYPTLPAGDNFVIPNHSGDHSAGHTGTPVNDSDIANKKYVDDNFLKLDTSNDPLTNHLDMNTNRIFNLGTPTADYNAATKKYVDDSIDTDVTTHINTAQAHSDYLLNTGDTATGDYTFDGTTLHIRDSVFPVFLTERTSALTTGRLFSLNILHSTTADMTAGFGSGMAFYVKDSAGTNRLMGFVSGIWDTSDTEGALVFGAGTNGAEEFMRINSLGYVGIGTTTPGRILEIKNADALIRYSRQDAWLWDVGIGSATNDIPNSYFGFIDISGGNVPLVIAHSTGNVGIGTVTPTSRLHVVGLPIYANNAAAVAGGLTAGSFYRTGADPDPVCVVH